MSTFPEEASPLNSSNKDEAPSSSSSSLELKYTPLQSIGPIVNEARETYSTHITHPYEFRMAQLNGIEKLLDENSSQLASAIQTDLGQGPMYCEIFEFIHAYNHVRFTKSHLAQWMTTRRKPTPFPINLSVPVHTELSPNPRGVALIITPWNVPIQMVLKPLIDALAAGNVVVIKMSERSLASTQLFTQLLTSGEYIDQNAIRVINGAVSESTELLKQRFDVIMYTGGGSVGKIVAKAAAKHLTPVLLELGGKNPAFVTKHAHIPSAASRIAWGKFTGNTGQMCICPDYVVVEECVKEEFVSELCKAVDQMYPVSTYSNYNGGDSGGGGGGGGGDNCELGKMISVQHAERVVNLLDSTCNVIYGGKHHDIQERFVSPTIVEANSDSTIMKEEIFGPLLAIVTVPNLDAGIQFVNTHFTSKGEHPLALYIFSKNDDERNKIMKAVPSGTCAVNDVLKQAGNIQTPFGGVGASGMGSYYGKFGFDFFSHYRGTLVENNYSTWKWDPTVWLIHPPFDGKKLFAFRMMGKLTLVMDRLKRVVPVMKVVIPIAFAMACIFNPSILDAMLELNLRTILNWISQMIMGST